MANELIQLPNGNILITGKGCGTLSPLKMLPKIPTNIEDHECTIIPKKVDLAFVNQDPACPMPEWIGDGFCDDVTNVPHCDYDAGDCCIEPVITYYCIECKCIEF